MTTDTRLSHLQIASADNVGAQVERARSAQLEWGALPVKDRMRFMRQLRRNIAANGALLGQICSGPHRTVAEAIASEVLPLADAIQFLERHTVRLLKPKRWRSWSRPFWLWGTDLEIHREPLGVVLIVAPSNYPLLLPGVQIVQALAAGNAVALKPAPGCSEPMLELRSFLEQSGIDRDLLQLLPTSIDSVHEAMDAGSAKIIFTGSTTAGRDVMRDAAEHSVPVIAELSGNDAVFVCDDADLPLTASALAFGLRFNGSATCVAPRRVFVNHSRLNDLLDLIKIQCEDLPSISVSHEIAVRMSKFLADVLREDAQLIRGEVDMEHNRVNPIVVLAKDPASIAFQQCHFGPILTITGVRDMSEGLRLYDLCPFKLGAAIFGKNDVRELTSRINAGVVTVNDLIVPHADARLPFGGRGASGFGTTRGAEGLLDMTRVKAVSRRAGRFRPHFDPPQPGQKELFLNYLEAAHGTGLIPRLRAVIRTVRSAMRLAKGNK